MKKTPRPDQNGHRRRQLTKRIKATTTHCALCNQPLNPTAKYPAPDATVIDEDIPRAHGGNPLDPTNTNALHNRCNRWKSTMTLNQARQLLAAGATTNQPVTKQQQKHFFNKHIGTWEAEARNW